MLDSLVSLLNSGARDWPRALPVPGEVNTGLLLRQFRMAGAWPAAAARASSGPVTGRPAPAWSSEGERARLVLTVVVGGAGQLRQAEIMLSP